MARAWTLITAAVAATSIGCSQRTGMLEPRELSSALGAGPLHLRIQYPPSLDSTAGRIGGEFRPDSGYILAVDSTFLFGNTGLGEARLWIDGTEIPVLPTGSWLAWVPVPDDTLATYQLLARAGDVADTVIAMIPLRRPNTPRTASALFDSTSFDPAGDIWVWGKEGVRFSVRAPRGAVVRLLAGQDTLVLIPDGASEDVSMGRMAFDTGLPVAPPSQSDSPFEIYRGLWIGALGPDPGPVLSPNFPALPGDSSWARLEVIMGADTARSVWPVRIGEIDPAVPQVALLSDDPGGTGKTEGIVPGRPVPLGTYHWFFPNGTRALVSGRINGQVRLQLSRRAVAWVNVPDVIPLHPGLPPPGGRTSPVRVIPGEKAVTLRVPLPGRIPFRVDEAEREIRLTLYGVGADMDWIQYGSFDPLIRLVEFQAPAEDETVLRIVLSDRVWGYRYHWSGTNLLLEIRRPPPIDRAHPLDGVRIAIDAGHPPAGATSPAGIHESVVNLAVAVKLADLLQKGGASPILIRDNDAPLGLAERTARAERAEADILVSIHANALPDGVNPFENNGTSVYYFHPRSKDLALAIDRALVRELGSRDLGIGRGDLALTRTSWMPAVLTEGLFLMIPEQEAVLLSREGQLRYARGVLDGLRAFLEGRSSR